MPRFEGEIPTGFRPPCPTCGDVAGVRYNRDFWDANGKKIRVYQHKNPGKCDTEWSMGEKDFRADVEEMIQQLRNKVDGFNLK